jgi:hypothetical protein
VPHRDGALPILRCVSVHGIRERESLLAAQITVGSAAEIKALRDAPERPSRRSPTPAPAGPGLSRRRRYAKARRKRQPPKATIPAAKKSPNIQRGFRACASRHSPS